LQYVFDPNEAALGDLLWQAIQAALSRWEPRIELLDVRVDRRDSEVKVTIDYGVIATRTQGSVSANVPVPGA
jgi:phage baseplate assembly protein W